MLCGGCHHGFSLLYSVCSLPSLYQQAALGGFFADFGGIFLKPFLCQYFLHQNVHGAYLGKQIT